jgi:hypothetical protein
MKNINHTLLLLIFISQIFSCTKPYELDFDNIEKRIVVNSLFFPDSLMSFYLTEEADLSENVSSHNFTTVENAQIVISANNNIIDTADYIEEGNYQAHFKPQIHVSYRVEVHAKGYNNVAAKDKIPYLTEIDSLKITKTNDLNYPYRIKIIFTDPDEQENYYLITAAWRDSSDNYAWREAYIETEDPAIGYWRNSLFKIPVFSDELFNGNQYELSLNLQVNAWKSMYYYFDLISISKSMYLYLKSYNAQAPGTDDYLMEYFQRGLIEPIPIYSNIEGGLGIFAGYAVSRDSIYIEAEYK